MSEDEDQNRHYIVLRRIFIVLAVLTAVPVVMWTITAFVREYVGPPKLPVFHHLATNTASEAPASAGTTPAEPPQPASPQAASSQPAAATMEARATLTDARDVPAVSAGASSNSLASSVPVTPPPATPGGSRGPDTDASMAVGTTKVADPPAVIAAADDATTNNGGAAAPPAGAVEAPAETLPAVQPLTGKIPLPRHRPSDLVMVQITADNVPMPRPRPSSTGGGDDGDGSGSPLNFIQNLFH